jgi:hypothetical protein
MAPHYEGVYSIFKGKRGGKTPCEKVVFLWVIANQLVVKIPFGPGVEIASWAVLRIES